MADNGPTLDAAPFERALAQFKMGLKKRDQEAFKKTTLADLKQCIGELQDKQHSSRRLQNLHRIQPFLEAMDQFGKVIAVFANTNDFVAFIWGPVKFLLLVSSTFLTAFKELLGVYEQIGERLPNILKYQQLFRTNSDVRGKLALLYEDILRFHHAALKYFQGNIWRQLFDATWKTHKSRFEDMISNMARHYDLLENTATLAQIEDHQKSNDVAVRQEELSQRKAVFDWLRPAGVENDHHHFTNSRRAYPETGKWLLDHDTFQEWFDPLYPMVPPLLWLNGIPGAGKTILASLIIEKAKELPMKPTVLYFYCKHGCPEQDNFPAVARTLLAQILKHDPDLVPYFYQNCCESGETVLESRATIEKLLKTGLDSCKSAYIIIDGLDECGRENRKEIAQYFRNAVADLPTSEPDRLRCLFVSQDDAYSKHDFSGIPSIKIKVEDNKKDIESYCLAESEKLTSDSRYSYHLARERASEIAKIVANSSSGMFLLAKLIWMEIFGQTSIAGLEEELEPDVFPTQISVAYNRILTRIENEASPTRWREVLMVLSWLVVAKRPLKWYEVQCLKAINLDKESVEYDREKFIIGPKDLFHSLVDWGEDGTIRLVHLSASYFLVDEKRIDLAAEEIKMATKCLDYLNLSTLASPTSTAVINGDYGFVDYAAIYWVRHIEAGLSGMNEHVEHDKHLNSLAESLENFLRQHYTTPTHPLPVSQRNRDKLAWFEDFEFFEDFLRSVVSTRKQITFFGKMKKGEIALDISEMASSIRKILEETYASAPEETVTGNLTEKYGDSIFKCPRFSCKYFNAGFASLEDRNRHCDKHDRPFRCTETACMNYHIGFATTGDLDKHMRETHSSVSQDEFPTDQDVQQSMLPEPVQQEPAPAPVVEVTQRAPEPEPEPDPEPEPQPDSDPEPILHPLPAQHRTRRKEKRRDFICNHCGKVFQKKYNWTSHLLTHSTSKPFKCKHCDKSFVRACDMRRHEGTHGEKKHVCAGCGQKFARADILKSHHKTRVGQLCIRPRVQMTTGQVEPGPSTEGSRSSSSG